MKTLTLLLTLLVSKAFAGIIPNDKKHCSLRLNNRLEISMDISKCDFQEAGDRCIGTITIDNGWLGGNICHYEPDFGHACTQVGIMGDEVTFKLTKKNKLKVVKVIKSDGHDNYYSDLESILLRKIFMRTKFQYQNGKMFIIRGLKKREMNCR